MIAMEKKPLFDESSFMKNYLTLLIDYEKEMVVNPSFFGKREVEAACRLWSKITRDVRSPSWLQGEQISDVPKETFLRISKKHRGRRSVRLLDHDDQFRANCWRKEG